MFSAPTKDDGGAVPGLRDHRSAEHAEGRSQLEGRAGPHSRRTASPPEEVAAAKKAWLQERRWARSQDAALAGLLLARARYDRTLKFDEELEAKVAALTPAQVTEAFRKHVDPSGITYVKAGDFKKASVYQQ